MKERDREIILEFKRRLTSDIRNQVKTLIVFGSRARGEEREDSDLDIIALVTDKTPDIEKKLEDIAYTVMWDYDFKPIITLKVFAESQFNDASTRGFSFYKHVEKEGIPV
jgi:predicted nucleotidyltransferase